MKKWELREAERLILKGYGLDARVLNGVAVQEYEKGEYVSREAQPLLFLFIVLAGKAKVFCDMENGRRFLVSFYESGGMIGDLEVMLGTDRASVSVQAISAFCCIAVPLDRGNLKYLKGSLRFISIAAGNLAHKLERSTKNSAHIILYPLEERLCSYIAVTNSDGVFAENLTEAAEVIGTSYRHFLRELSRLVNLGILEKEGKSYRVKDMEELLKCSRDFYCPVEGMKFAVSEENEDGKEDAYETIWNKTVPGLRGGNADVKGAEN